MATVMRIEAEQGAPTELAARIHQLGRDCALLSVGELCHRTDRLRVQAAAGGFAALARLAGALGDALAKDGRAAPVRIYIDLMEDALGCAGQGAAAGEALLAAASVRLA
ncbi:hypothetical protein [Sphingomonas jatrophae]|uniref:Hpt domain-containing protein n=1 Tax=Sphingomonas jatrophae TaxID=1166337 RepID=A0A1I6LMM5_9SPHN|nr:hypothetical protein [Sphingomonas jatrophae]SFS04746.1 hypothetical protein SAMN05192580_2987 [Sphingomonas jatrophae]